MKTLMRNGRDRRSENPLWGHAKKERVLLFGTDQRITSGPAAKTAAFKGRIHGCTRTLRRYVKFLLHRGRRPYMAHSPRHGAWPWRPVIEEHLPRPSRSVAAHFDPTCHATADSENGVYGIFRRSLCSAVYVPGNPGQPLRDFVPKRGRNPDSLLFQNAAFQLSYKRSPNQVIRRPAMRL